MTGKIPKGQSETVKWIVSRSAGNILQMLVIHTTVGYIGMFGFILDDLLQF
jgi:hypothetical protein